MFQEALKKATTCAETRLSEAGDLLNTLSENGDRLQTFASQALEELRNCTKLQSNFFMTGACLGSVGLQSEFKGAALLAQSGLLVSFNQGSNAAGYLGVFRICNFCPLLENT